MLSLCNSYLNEFLPCPYCLKRVCKSRNLPVESIDLRKNQFARHVEYEHPGIILSCPFCETMFPQVVGLLNHVATCATESLEAENNTVLVENIDEAPKPTKQRTSSLDQQSFKTVVSTVQIQNSDTLSKHTNRRRVWWTKAAIMKKVAEKERKMTKAKVRHHTANRRVSQVYVDSLVKHMKLSFHRKSGVAFNGMYRFQGNFEECYDACISIKGFDIPPKPTNKRTSPTNASNSQRGVQNEISISKAKVGKQTEDTQNLLNRRSLGFKCVSSSLPPSSSQDLDVFDDMPLSVLKLVPRIEHLAQNVSENAPSPISETFEIHPTNDQMLEDDVPLSTLKNSKLSFYESSNIVSLSPRTPLKSFNMENAAFQSNYALSINPPGVNDDASDDEPLYRLITNCSSSADNVGTDRPQTSRDPFGKLSKLASSKLASDNPTSDYHSGRQLNKEMHRLLTTNGLQNTVLPIARLRSAAPENDITVWKPFSCDYCDERFSKRGSLYGHFFRMHSKRSVLCMNCSQLLRSHSEWLVHEDICKSDAESLTAEMRCAKTQMSYESCPFCDKKFTGVSTVKDQFCSHLRKKHEDKLIALFGEGAKSDEKTDEPPIYSFKCIFCNFVSVSQVVLPMTWHLRLKHPNERLACEGCDFSCSVLADLTSHQFTCKTCPIEKVVQYKLTAHKSHLYGTSHKYKKLNKTKFEYMHVKCTCCEEEFGGKFGKEQLIQHFSSLHKTLRMFPCKFCGSCSGDFRSFLKHEYSCHLFLRGEESLIPTVQFLIKDEIFVERENPEVCKEVDFTLAVCPYCFREFRDISGYSCQSILCAHVLKYHPAEQMQCEYCDETFDKFYQLMNHVYSCNKSPFSRNSVGNDRITCPHCALIMRDLFSLYNHLNEMHDSFETCCRVCCKMFKTMDGGLEYTARIHEKLTMDGGLEYTARIHEKLYCVKVKSVEKWNKFLDSFDSESCWDLSDDELENFTS